MKIALCIVSVLFAALSAAAALSQMKKKEQRAAHILMAAGGVLLIAAAVCCFLSWQGDVFIALPGCVMICAAAIWNGKASGSFHIQHHIIRIALSIVLVLGFIFL